MSRTLRKRCKFFWRNSSFDKKIHRDSGGINSKGPSFYKNWFTRSHRLEWRRVLKSKDFDYDNFIAPIRELGYWW